MPPERQLLQARYDPDGQGFVTKTGFLKVTLAPCLHGGGAKDRKYTEAQASLASFLLERGLPLSETSSLVDRVMPAAGMGRVQQLLKLTNLDNRWASFEALCQQFHIPCPPVDLQQDRIMRRVTQEARRKAQAGGVVSAKDKKLQSGFFRHSDDSPANLLCSPFPDSTGVV